MDKNHWEIGDKIEISQTLIDELVPGHIVRWKDIVDWGTSRCRVISEDVDTLVLEKTTDIRVIRCTTVGISYEKWRLEFYAYLVNSPVESVFREQLLSDEMENWLLSPKVKFRINLPLDRANGIQIVPSDFWFARSGW